MDYYVFCNVRALYSPPPPFPPTKAVGEFHKNIQTTYTDKFATHSLSKSLKTNSAKKESFSALVYNLLNKLSLQFKFTFLGSKIHPINN